MGFSAYWKEIAVVLAAVFAIVGAVFDVRDKRSGQITNWGRIFFLLTILSMIGGFYAQWQDTAKEEADNLEAQKKTLQAQRDTLTIIRNTQTSVHDLSRLLFPIGKPTVSISLQLNCSVQRYVRFCKEVGETADRSPRDEISRMNDMLVMTSEQVDWSSWPSYDYSKGLRSPIYIAFFKDSTAAEEFLDPDKAAKPDMELLVSVTVTSNTPRDDFAIPYDLRNHSFQFLVGQSNVSPSIGSGNVMSVIDFPGSTVILYAPYLDTQAISISDVEIITDNNQGASLGPFDTKTIKGNTYFIEHVPLSMSR